MEKKTKSAKETKKTATKAAVEKVAEKVVEKVEKVNPIVNYTDILNKIFYSLVVIVVLLALLLITIVVKGNTNFSASSNGNGGSDSTQTEEAPADYDVSMMDTLSTTDTISRIKEGTKTVVYIGRSTCGYCVKFLPTLQKAQKEYNYKTVYINLEEMTSDDQTNLKELDNEEKFIEESLGYTPMVMIFEDGKLKDTWLGYADYDSFAQFLEKNEYKK